MVDVLDDHHQYVPCSSAMVEVDIHNEAESIRLDSFHKVMYFGDQLTVERMRCAQAIRCNSENDVLRLKGVIPAISDWHAKVSLLGVSTLCDLTTCVIYILYCRPYIQGYIMRNQSVKVVHYVS